LLVSQLCARSGMSITEMETTLRSCRAPPLHIAATDEAHDQHQYHRACKGHDDLADNRVADYLELDVEEAREEAPQKCSQDSHDDVAEEAKPMTQRNAAGKETRNQPYEAPDQDRAPVQIDRVPVDRYSHVIHAPGANCRMSSHP
jgi:hypothetical protein